MAANTRGKKPAYLGDRSKATKTLRQEVADLKIRVRLIENLIKLRMP